ncbi:fatty acyl-AMP ligase [Streptacidiphilus sp. PB12-B1b]|uniref:fatty acyl-AMP ligase n=1 Tax=Streptacidiphilus sp. PB12-B1b TaxID=2705012 RepID=UPI0015FB2C28|nr:fatty acyl-AMP ligase [Streptacidiphilus sp. PB12-B1b]QMU78145.1 fatty acyl-AMP ligase [Streptacidiphilus sp. PB12-B1b]
MYRPRTFTELLLSRAADLADRTALVFLRGPRDGNEPQSLSYRQLDRAARAVAAWIQAHGGAGQRVMVLQSDGRAFVESFVGCLYAGAVAVPAPPPDGGPEHMRRCLGIIRDADVRLVLTDAQHVPDVTRRLAAAGRGATRCLATDLLPDLGGDWRMPDLARHDLAFLQYTSGSTSEPKGVMVAHRNLMANQAAISRAMRTDSTSVVGGWLPFHHDMGLVGHLLHPLWLGATGVTMTPSSFVRKPVSWLRMISDHGVTTGGGPDFGYRQCLERVSDDQLEGLDLSRWTTAVNGSEPVNADTLRRFADRFAPVGLRREALYPSYGMAESTLLVTGGPSGRIAPEFTADAAALAAHRLVAADSAAPESRTLVSSGQVRDTELRIVDPDTRRALPDGSVGEIWVRGDSVCRGYWNRPRESGRAFHATTADGDPGYFRTGDLGVLRDGELYVTGRLKEIVILAGRNLYPQDIEGAVQRASLNFGIGAAFGVDTGRDQVVLVQEVRRAGTPGLDLHELVATAQRCILREFDIPAWNVMLVRPGTVRRTTSGKLQRGEMRRLLLQGGIEPIYQVLHPELRELIGSGAGPTW